MANKSLPLEGLKVLDFSNILAGPVIGMYLHWMGAECIRVESPIGCPCRYVPIKAGHPEGQIPLNGTMYTVFNRGKKGMVIDMETQEGRDLAHQLIKEWPADIVIVGYKPSDLPKLQMDYETLKELKKDIIVISATAFGLSGPSHSKAGYENIAQALSGIQYVQGDPSAPPSKLYPHPGDSILAGYGIGAALLALRHRDKTGQGQLVDMSLSDCLVYISEYLITNTVVRGVPPERTGNIDFTAGPYSSFPTKDNRYVTIGAVSEPVYKRLLKAVEDVGGKELEEKWGSHPMGKKMLSNIYKYNEDFSEMTRKLDSSDLVKRCDKASVPAGLVRNYKEVLEDEHFKARGVIRWVDHGNGKLPHPGSCITSSAYDINTDAPSPCFGEHTNEILKQVLNLDENQCRKLYESGITRPRPITVK